MCIEKNLLETRIPVCRDGRKVTWFKTGALWVQIKTYKIVLYSAGKIIDVMEYLGAGGPVVNSQNVDKGITTLAMNINT